MNSHVPGTWLVANLLHPVAMFLYFNEGPVSVSAIDIPGVFQVVGFSFLFSLPSLLLGFLADYLISFLRAGAGVKFITWFATAPLIALLNFVLLFLVFGGSFLFTELQIALPAMMAVAVAVLLRHRSFFNSIHPIKIKRDATNMV